MEKGFSMEKKKSRKVNNSSLMNGFIKKQVNKNKRKEENTKKREEEARLKKIEEEKRLEEERVKKELALQRERDEEKKRLEKDDLKTFKIKITTLSPIHIGSGYEYEPSNYVIRESILYSFNEHIIIEKLYERDKKLPTEHLLSNLNTLVSFFRSESDFIIDNNLYIKKIPVAKDIARLYKKDFGLSNNNDESINQMLINEHISTRTANNKILPYIAGSSFKGALQTVLNLSLEESKKLKISDSIPINVKNQIVWSVRQTSKGTIPQKLEVISKGSILELLFTKTDNLSFKEIKHKIDEQYQKADSQGFINFTREIKNKNQFILRIGRYCGQKFMVDKPENFNPKTKSLFRAEEKKEKTALPFGWILCEVLKDTLYND